MAYRKRRHRMGAVRTSGTLSDVLLIAGGSIAGGYIQGKFLTSLDPKIKGAVFTVAGMLGFGSRNHAIKYLSAGVAASGAYNLARGFNLIAGIPTPVGLLPQYAQTSHEHVKAVGSPLPKQAMMVGMLDQ